VEKKIVSATHSVPEALPSCQVGFESLGLPKTEIENLEFWDLDFC